MPVASSGGPLRSESVSDPGFFQITDSALCLECVRFCMHPLRVKSVFPTTLWLSICKFHCLSKPDVLGAHLSSKEPQAWELNVVVGPLSSWQEPLQLWFSFSLWVAYLGVWILTILHLHLSHSSHRGSFSGGKSFLLVFRLLLSIVAL